MSNQALFSFSLTPMQRRTRPPRAGRRSRDAGRSPPARSPCRCRAATRAPGPLDRLEVERLVVVQVREVVVGAAETTPLPIARAHRRDLVGNERVVRSRTKSAVACAPTPMSRASRASSERLELVAASRSDRGPNAARARPSEIARLHGRDRAQHEADQIASPASAGLRHDRADLSFRGLGAGARRSAISALLAPWTMSSQTSASAGVSRLSAAKRLTLIACTLSGSDDRHQRASKTALDLTAGIGERRDLDKE